MTTPPLPHPFKAVLHEHSVFVTFRGQRHQATMCETVLTSYSTRSYTRDRLYRLRNLDDGQNTVTFMTGDAFDKLFKINERMSPTTVTSHPAPNAQSIPR